MAFLDNSGDIILDAVLTDTGRMRLAKGDGSFKIVKFALGDDEVNYERYDKNHSSGSAYYDLEVLQTPVLEAFTDNAASMKSKLISIPRTNLLYLPILKLNDIFNSAVQRHAGTKKYMVAVDDDTEDEFSQDTNTDPIVGVLYGERPKQGDNFIRIDQGLDSNYELSPSRNLDSDLVETQYMIEIDNRLGSIISKEGQAATPSFIDDDQIATYYFSLGTDRQFVSEITSKSTNTGEQVIAGPRGTKVQFKLQASIELNTSDFLFDQLGSAATLHGFTSTTTSIKQIDATIRVTGATTGYRIDIPIRFIKKQ
tara:strand:- start:2821 stop:3753 length:933 start_codon:yes stop_codon:yes gene_type:complete